MNDNQKESMKSKKYLAIGVIALLVVLLFVIKAINSNKNTTNSSTPEVDTFPTDIVETVTEVVTPTPTASSYESSIKGNKDSTSTTEVPVVEITPTPPPELSKLVIYCSVTGSTGVPKKNLDGSSYKDFLNGLKLSDFDLTSAVPISDKELQSSSYTLVGTEQIKSGSLRSLGWLLSNLDDLDNSTPVYFTNLHVIGSLDASEKVVLLCSYDWYSAFGLKDTMVLFMDDSGTLSSKDFEDGDIISTVVFVKNIEKKSVNGQNIICIKYVTE